MELAPAENNDKRLLNYRPTFVLAVGFMAGIAALGLVSETSVPLFAALAVVSTGALLVFKQNRFALFTLAILLGLLAGYVSRPSQFENGDYTVTGIVKDVAVNDGKTTVILKDVALDGKPINKSAEVSLFNNKQPSIGDSVQANAKCRMPKTKFGTYDELHSKLSAGIGCMASTSKLVIKSRHNLPVTEFLINIRSAVSKHIDAAFENDSGIFNALILGVRTELGEERYSAYAASGTAHLLALSGFHMGIVSGAVSSLIPKRRKKLKLIIVSAAMFLYCSVAAYAPGFVRAAIMSVCFLAADNLERRADPLSSLSIAALLILAVNPFQLYSIGFQLSFAACFGIALYNTSFKRGTKRLHIPKKVGSAVSVSASAILGTLAFQMRYFNSFSPYAILCNLLAVPAFSIIVILGIVASGICFIVPTAGKLIAVAPRAVLFVTEKWISLFSKLPGANFQTVSPPLWGCFIFLIMLFVFSEYTLRPFKKRMLPGMTLMLLFTFSCFIGIIAV